MNKAPAASFRVVTTREGAAAMLDLDTGEVMHPVVGPLVEAEQLYLGPSRLAERLRAHPHPELVLLDVGLGAGSNAVAALALSEARTAPGPRLDIVSFDRTAAAMALALAGEHAEAFGFAPALREAGQTLLRDGVFETTRTRWRLVLGELPETLEREPAHTADVVFWDPFSPKQNPALWSVAAFSALRRLCRDGASVHTYSGATATRTALLLAGFVVGFGPELGGKKRATAAATQLESLREPCTRRFLERLLRSSAPLPSDAPEDALTLLAALPQLA
jgi:queuine tRNA-ribosyltransferase